MGIPHVTLDLRERFRAEVVDRFVDGYAAGLTPNPCVRCNGEVRFDAMLDLAGTLGAGAPRHRPLRPHRARRARAADPRRRRPAQGPELHARQARPRAARPALLPARRPHQGRRARARPRRRPAGGRQAREPGPLLRRRPRRPRLPAPPRRPAPAPAGRDRRPRRPRARPPRRPARVHRRPAPRPRRAAPEPLYVLEQGRRHEPGHRRAARTRSRPRRVRLEDARLHRPADAGRAGAAALPRRADPLPARAAQRTATCGSSSSAPAHGRGTRAARVPDA